MNKIAWEKLGNPDDVIDLQHEISQMINSEMEDEDGEIMGASPMIYIENEKVKTPFGEYYEDDPLSPYSRFDCWIGNTNFPITQKEFDILNNVAGVGALKVLSRYSFCIGIEKLFQFTTVRANIHGLLCGSGDETFEAMRKFDETLYKVKNYDKWAIFVGNDNSIFSINSEHDEDFDEQLEILKERKEGKIITCHKC